ncbi:hypothetical protein RKD37_006375 [Streptomyces ambofaciens]
MRRGIAATALVASLALAATACGGDDGDSESGGPVTITYWDTSNATNEAPTYKALVKEFEAANKGVKVNFVNVPFDQAQNKFDTAAGSKGAPDVLRSEVGWTPAFAKKGFFLPLDGTEALAEQDKFQPNLIEQAKYEGKTYGVPLVTDTLALVYNKELFKKAGVEAPKTWDDLKKAAATIKDKTGADGYWASTAGYYAQPFLYGEGTDTVDAEGKKITVNSPAAKKGYGTWLSLFDGKGLHKGRHHRGRLRPHPGGVRQRQGRLDHPGPVGDHQLLQGVGLQGPEQPRHRHRPGRFHRQGGRPDRRPQPVGLRRFGPGPPGGGAEVREVHDLGEVPGDRRPEELHAADPRRRLHRQGQGRPGHRRLPDGPARRPAAPGAARVQLPVDAARRAAPADRRWQEVPGRGAGRHRDGDRQAGAGLQQVGPSDRRAPAPGGGARRSPAVRRTPTAHP